MAFHGDYSVLTTAPIDFNELTDRVRSPLAGAVCLFLGTVRKLTGERQTTKLDYDCYPEMAEQVLATIEAEVRAKWPVIEVAIVHRTGALAVGEISVAVAVSSPHRADAFAAAQYAIDELKARVPIWKKEYGSDGTYWVSERP